jgi:ABC-type multidrug transport system ATPase subunit
MIVQHGQGRTAAPDRGPRFAGSDVLGVEAPVRGVRIDVDGLSRTVRVRHRGDLTLLDAASFTVAAGELVAIIGPSGAGKTTLLHAIAGIGPITSGSVRYDGIDVRANPAAFRGVLGYVPQDDIVHAELPLRRMLRYAARLRLPSSTSAAEVEAAVDDAIDAVGLAHQADVRVGALSGGQRKRASIAAELLTDPHVFFLDEPTSGLDPITGTEIVSRLRHLADRSATVVFTTHSVDDLQQCDRVVCMARGGRVAFVGTPTQALERFGVGSIADLYRDLDRPDGTVVHVAPPGGAEPPRARGPREHEPRVAATGLTQWAVLTHRTLETLLRNRLTMAILLGSPALVVAMFAVLFRPGAFDFGHPTPSSMVMIGFWIVFAAFFFGLTYGLLQICTERPILERERAVGLRLDAYVASKVTVLVPFLVLVVVAMLGVLRLLDRLPERSLSTYASIGVGLLLCAVAALGLGLLTSATVGNVAQATLALPMLCFPAVLFSGAILPVHLMAGAGAALSRLIPSRWAFEVIGHDLGARRILADGGSRLGPPLLASYGDAGTQPTGRYWLVLVVFALVFLVGAWGVLVRSTRTSKA